MKNIIKEITPPILFRKLKRVKNLKSNSKEAWFSTKANGFEMKFSSPLIDWSEEMVNGSYDSFFYDFLSQFKFSGGIGFEIGAHVGYHALNFSSILGDEGVIHAFEPNPFNFERIKENLEKNITLKNKILAHPYAVSNENGELNFVFSQNINDGFSSGSHLAEADTPLNDDEYRNLGFIEKKVKVISLDNFIESESLDQSSIKFLKIDVEGAESLVLEGARKLISAIHPLILIEIHSILNMYQVSEFFREFSYKHKILKKEDDGRLIIGFYFEK